MPKWAKIKCELEFEKDNVLLKKKIQQNKQTPLTTKAKQQQKNQGGLYTVYGYCEGKVIE